MDSVNATNTLQPSTLADGFQAIRLSPMGRSTVHKVETLSNGANLSTQIAPNATTPETQETFISGSLMSTSSDGSSSYTTQTPDPRFGMQAPLASTSITLPSQSLFGLTINRLIDSTRLVTLSNPLDATSLTHEHDVTTVNGRAYVTDFDAATMSLTTTSPAGRTTATFLDARGRPSKFQKPGFADVNYTYDTAGRLTQLLQVGTVSASRLSKFHFDPVKGFMDSSTDALNQTTSYQTDAVGRVIAQTRPDGQMVGFGFDGNSNLTSVTPPGKPVHQMAYTAVNLLQDDLPPPPTPGAAGTYSTHYIYNPDRQLTQVQRADGRVVNYNFHPTQGQLLSITDGGGAVFRNYAYDPASGRLSSVTGSDGGVLTPMYTGPLVEAQSWSGGSVQGAVTTNHNPDLVILKISVSGGLDFIRCYDPDLLTGQVVSPLIGAAFVLANDAQTGLVKQTGITPGTRDCGVSGGAPAVPQTVDGNLSHNEFGELTQAVYAMPTASGTIPLLAGSYTRDNLGRVTKKTESIGSAPQHVYEYGYDLAGRLSTVTRDGVLASKYDFDANGNRTQLTQGAVAVTGSYDNQDRLTSYGSLSFSYANSGELTGKTDSSASPAQVTSYGYDLLGNLNHVGLPGSISIDYVLDGQSRRIGKKVNGVLAQGFLYQDQLRVAAELDGSSQLRNQFAYGSKPNVPEIMIQGTGVSAKAYRIYSDELGSPKVVMDLSTNAIVQQMDYDEYGNVLMDTNPGFQPFGFAGCLYDRDTKLCHFGAREYDPAVGRWLSKDPIFPRSGLNPYVYVANNPLRFIDPFGLDYTVPDPGTGGLLVYPGNPGSGTYGPPQYFAPSDESNTAVTTVIQTFQDNANQYQSATQAATVMRDSSTSQTLADAEHYLYAQDLVQNQGYPAGYVDALVLGYAAQKAVYTFPGQSPGTLPQLGYGLAGANSCGK